MWVSGRQCPYSSRMIRQKDTISGLVEYSQLEELAVYEIRYVTSNVVLLRPEKKGRGQAAKMQVR